MRIGIEHVLTLTPPPGTANLVFQLLLTPASGPTQRVVRWRLDWTGGGADARFTDAYGNALVFANRLKPEGPIEIVARGVVETSGGTGVLGRPPGEPVRGLYLRTTQATRVPVALYARLRALKTDRIGLLHALMARVGEAAESAEGQAQSQPGQAQAQGAERAKPDAAALAHSFVGAARALDIPARFVTGYVLDGAVSGLHAWAEAYDPGLGWIGFDPLLQLCPAERHVRLAVGLDAASAAPLRAVPSAEGRVTQRVAVREAGGRTPMSGCVLAIDQGTTSSRAIVFGDGGTVLGVGQREFAQIFPRDGWVEHAADAIWSGVVGTVREALERAGKTGSDIAGIGITNQRETTLIWDRETGEPIHNAIVWQDRRTAPLCARLRAEEVEELVTARTGLLLDPYFSATKIAWLLENVPGARARAERGALAFGTVDSFLVWKLTGGRRHLTDATNASRTLLFNLLAQRWDPELMEIFGVPEALLPEVLDCADDYGTTDPDLFGAAIPIRGVAGDQHAASMGQACFAPGMVKSTYGTGCFALLNTGTDLVRSQSRLLTTLAYRLKGEPHFALEGSIFIAGAAVQWIRDGLGLVAHARETGALARAADPGQEVYMVPAFVGLGAPWWDAEARGAIYGITRNTGPAEIARAALESVSYQTRDLLDAMRRDWGAGGETVLRVDGGMAGSDWAMQFLADILDAPVDRPKMLETTALGAAWLAGSAAGVWPGAESFAQGWACERRFTPQMDEETRARKLAGWDLAVRRTLLR